MCLPQSRRISNLKNGLVMIRKVIMGVRRQHYCHLQRSFSKLVSTSYLEDEDKDENEKMIQSDTELRIKHLNTLWDIRFE